MISFGEVVMFKLATDKGKRHKLDSEWSRGVIVGMISRTTEMVIANEEGIFKCRTVRRVPTEHMTDPKSLEKVKVGVSEFLKTAPGRQAPNPRSWSPYQRHPP